MSEAKKKEIVAPERLELESMGIVDEQKQKLKVLFPEVFTESGKIDFDRLRLSLGESVDTGKERYGLSWSGKSDCYRTIQRPSTGTLIPKREESIDFDETENVIIEGDNLEVLKLLQKSYLNKVKMIYIDPPYNTGNDFIYPDDYAESLETYLQYTQQVDSSGRRFSTNAETDGRFHSKWINMMYPRLFLARNLMRSDGLIFISIDDFELQNLRACCDEIFGEENFVECMVWKKRYGGGAKEKYLVSLHEYILVYAKSLLDLNEIFVPTSREAIERYYTLKDDNYEVRGPFRTHPLEATKSMGDRPNLRFGIVAPDGTEVMPKRQWLWSKDRVQEASQKGELAFLKDKDGNWSVHTKQYLRDEEGNQRQAKAFSIIDDIFTQHGTNEIIDLFGDAHAFSFPKPSTLISRLLQPGASEPDSIILDFFAGSGTTGQAVLDYNNSDGGGRRFILVQLPEPIEKGEFRTIADITKERLRRVVSRIRKNSEASLQPLFANSTPKMDLGFRVFRLDSSNFQLWDPNSTPQGVELIKQVEIFVDHIKPDRSQEDILHEILLKSGFELSVKIVSIDLAGLKVFDVHDRSLAICLEKKLTKECILEIAKLNPIRVVCLDAGFAGNDQLKVNAVETFKAKGITFKTV